MNSKLVPIGIIFALSAALLNSSIAIFSKNLFAYGLEPEAIAFYKSIIAVLILWVLPLKQGERPVAKGAAICAFLGIFVLFFFETKAYSYEMAANVVFTMMASAAFSSVLLSRVILSERIQPLRWAGFLICLFGLALLLDISQPQNSVGIFFASMAGFGYGAFSVLAKKMNLGSGLIVTRSLLTWGAVYLFLPAFTTGLQVPPLNAVPLLLGLALLPSIGGFYCTTRAINLLTPSQVQICELSEPVFVLLLSALFLYEIPSAKTLVGATAILTGIYIANKAYLEIDKLSNIQGIGEPERTI